MPCDTRSALYSGQIEVLPARSDFRKVDFTCALASAIFSICELAWAVFFQS